MTSPIEDENPLNLSSRTMTGGDGKDVSYEGETARDDESEAGAIAVSAFALASAMKLPPAYSAKLLMEAKGTSCRVNHSLVSHEGTMYCFGGRGPGTNQYLPSSVAKYVASRIAWVDMPAKGTPPMRRGDHTAVVAGEKMIIFGGRKQNVVYDDMFAFDLLQATWERIDYERTSGPGPVFNHCAVYSANKKTMFVVGGVHTQFSRRHLLHAFDWRGKYWENIQGPPTVDPGGLHEVVCAVDDDSDQLFVLGLVEDLPVSLHDAQQQAHPSSSVLSSRPSIQTIAARTKAARVAESAFLMMLIMDMTTLAWRRVRTEVSPSSSIPFSMEHFHRTVLQHITSTPHANAASRRIWCFPVNLSEAVVKQEPPREDPSARRLPNAKRGPAPPAWVETHIATFGHDYGMFVFSFEDLSWSLVALAVPKKKKALNADASEANVKTAFFTAAGTPMYEHKYVLTPHIVRANAGSQSHDGMVLFGGPSPHDYVFSLIHPSAPPRIRGNHGLDVHARAAQQRTVAWQDHDAEDAAVVASTPLGHPQHPPAESSLPPLANHQPKPTPPSSARRTQQQQLLQPSAPHPPALAAPTSAKTRKAAAQFHRVVLPTNPSFATTVSIAHPSQCPVSVIESREKLQQWVSSYYKEECRWVIEQRNLVEKQFANAKRAAGRKSAVEKDKAEPLAPAPSPARRGSVSRVTGPSAPPKSQIVGTLLFDSVDLHPDVKLRVGPSAASSSPVKAQKLRRASWAVRTVVRKQSVTFARPPRSGSIFCPDPSSATEGASSPQQQAMQSLESRKVALVHWAMLRKRVLSGEAVTKIKAADAVSASQAPLWTPFAVSSAPQLAIMPTLCVITGKYAAETAAARIAATSNNESEQQRQVSTVPTKPVPYSVSNRGMSALVLDRVDDNGMVHYRPEHRYN